MAHFEKVTRFKDDDGFSLPTRKTANSAGYDLQVAANIIIPSYSKTIEKLYDNAIKNDINVSRFWTLNEIKTLAKITQAKPTLVSTGVKCYLDDNQYLELSARSSTPLNYWLILANGVGIIDADYADNPDNEGEIFLQMINLSPFDIVVQKGETIGQGIIKTYSITDDDEAEGDRLGGFGSTTE